MKTISINSGIRGILFAYKTIEMPAQVNQALFNLITATMGDDAADCFAHSMRETSCNTYTYNGDVNYVWKTIKANLE